MEIWVAILGILVGAISCYVLDRKRKVELEVLTKEKADLSAKLTKAEEEKADSETQLDEARTEISSLTEQLDVANRQISSLTEQLDEARTEISSLTEQLDVANRQISSLTEQLDVANRQIDNLTEQLDEAKTKISSLTEQLDEARTEISSLTEQLDEARTEISSLTGQLDEAKTKISSLTEQLDVANRQISSLTEQLDEARAEISSLTEQVNVANRQIDNLTEQLDEARAEISSLTEQVNVANRQIDNLTERLDEARTGISSLTEQLDVANRQIGNLTTQLSEVSVGNESALKLLYLFELSLQLTAFALYSEMSRAKHLGVENRKFDAAYKNLHAEYEDIFDTYADFREKVERKAKRRVVQSGAGLVLSLIPGVGAIQLVADLIELADFASDISENTADFYDLLSVAELYITSSTFLEDFVDYKSIKPLHPDISSDQDRERVKQEYQTVFKEVLMENLDQDDKEPDASDIDHFLMTIIQRVENLVASAPEGARRNALRNMVDKFSQFGISSYTYHESSNMDVDQSLPVPKD